MTADVFADLVFAEVRLFDLVESRLRTELGIGVTTFLPLRVVDQIDRCRVQDVSRQLGISVGGASKAVDRAERSGWCLRRADPDDRRSSVVATTAAGRRLLARADRLVAEVTETELGLPPSRLDVFARTLARLRSQLTEA